MIRRPTFTVRTNATKILQGDVKPSCYGEGAADALGGPKTTYEDAGSRQHSLTKHVGHTDDANNSVFEAELKKALEHAASDLMDRS